MTTRNLHKELLLYFALLCWFVVPSKAQLTIFHDYVFNGSEITYHIKVNGFTDVAGFQIPLNWDSSILEFVESDFASDLKKVETSFLNDNQYRIVWFHGNGVGLNLEEDTKLATFTFKLLSTIADTAIIDFDDQGDFVLEFTKSYQGQIEVSSRNSVIDLTRITPNNNINFTNDFSILAYPNPIDDVLTIEIEDVISKNVKIKIFNTLGGIIYLENIVSSSSRIVKKINKSLFKSGGIYFLNISTAKKSKTLKLTLNDIF